MVVFKSFRKIKVAVILLLSLFSDDAFAQAPIGTLNTPFVVVQDTVYFWAYDSTNHLKLFTVDPGSDSARQVMDFLPGGDDSTRVGYMKAVGNKLFFVANAPGTGYQKLFSIEKGSTAAPVQVSNTAGATNDDVRLQQSTDSMLYFSSSINSGEDRLYGVNLTTNAVSQISIGCVDGASNPCYDDPQFVAEINANLYFTAYDMYGLTKLYIKKPALAAVEVHGVSGLIANPGGYKVVGTKLFFTACDLNESDCDGSDTYIHKLFVHDGTSSVQIQETNSSGSDEPYVLALLDNDLYYVSNDNSSFSRLYKLTNATGVPVLLTTINATASDSPRDLFKVGSDLYFTASSDALGNNKLFKLTSLGVRTQISDTAGAGFNDDPYIQYVLNHYLFLSSLDENGITQSYYYDTQSETLNKLIDFGLNRGTYASGYKADGDDVYFVNYVSKRTGSALYKFNTISGDLTDLTRFSASAAQTTNSFKLDQDQLFFVGGTRSFSEDLGGASVGFWSASDYNSFVLGNFSTALNSVSTSQFGAYVFNNVYIGYNNVINKIGLFDYLNPGVTQKADVAGPGNSESVNSEIYATSSGGMYFVAHDGVGYHLYFSDGTTTTQLPVNVGGDDELENIRLVGDQLYFMAKDGMGVRYLYKADITNPLIKFNSPGSVSNATQNYKVTSSKVYFTADNGSGFQKLYQSNLDGTGLSLVVEINFGANDNIYQIEVVGSDLFLLEDNGTKNLYHYNSVDGLSLVNIDGSIEGFMREINGKLYISKIDGGSYYLDEIDSSQTVTTVSVASKTDLANVDYANGSLFYVAQEQSKNDSGLYRYSNGLNVEVQMPDSDTHVLDQTIKASTDGYLYFIAKSSSSMREYFRYKH